MGEDGGGKNLSTLRWRLYIPVSCILCFVFGSTYSLSAFSLSLREYDPSMLSAFTSGLSIQSFVAAITLCTGAYFLDFFPQRLRQFTMFGVIAMVFQSVAAYAVKVHSAGLMSLALSIEGLGVGVIYLVGVEHTARWMPDAPGLAMGISMGSMGMGQIFGAKCYDAMAVWLGGIVNGMHATTAVFTIPTFFAALIVRYPPEGWDPRSVEEIALLGDKIMSNNTGVRLGWRLVAQWQFYCLLWIVAMGAGPSFGILSGFPAVLNGLFGMSPGQAASWFAAMSVVSMVTRFCTGILADVCGFGAGFFWSGGKNLSIIIFSLQSLAFILIGVFYHAGSFSGVMLCISITFMSFSGAGVLAAIMCRQMFAPRNAAVVFGIAAGLTDGLATMLFGMYMAAVEDAAAVSAEPAEVYLSYFSNVIAWSLVGVVCSFLMNKCRAAFEEQLDNGVVIEYKEVERGEDVATVENGELVTKPIGTGMELEDSSPNFAYSGRSLSLSVGRSLTAVLRSDMNM
ncbi:hypothetical protein NDN08_005040 [Rhodosorus marinus]|uniref:Major facilitator superfamily (MFS) profile domain-containing protein n=1 Tax=Rhodosorus marinus TaxID=101924 RepID=A0AAV8V3L5_9RHOD|nr:hypothetical protein NDN08_005040 [Rhodosorus marinus]